MKSINTYCKKLKTNINSIHLFPDHIKTLFFKVVFENYDTGVGDIDFMKNIMDEYLVKDIVHIIREYLDNTEYKKFLRRKPYDTREVLRFAPELLKEFPESFLQLEKNKVYDPDFREISKHNIHIIKTFQICVELGQLENIRYIVKKVFTEMYMRMNNKHFKTFILEKNYRNDQKIILSSLKKEQIIKEFLIKKARLKDYEKVEVNIYKCIETAIKNNSFDIIDWLLKDKVYVKWNIKQEVQDSDLTFSRIKRLLSYSVNNMDFEMFDYLCREFLYIFRKKTIPFPKNTVIPRVNVYYDEYPVLTALAKFNLNSYTVGCSKTDNRVILKMLDRLFENKFMFPDYVYEIAIINNSIELFTWLIGKGFVYDKNNLISMINNYDISNAKHMLKLI